MAELSESKLGTPRDTAPVTWLIHRLASSLVGELFTGGYYRTCIKYAESFTDGKRDPTLSDINSWAKRSRKEDFHTVNSHAFITAWAAQEAGMESIIAEIIRTSDSAAVIALSKLGSGTYSSLPRPWEEDVCLDIAKKLERKAIKATPNGVEDIALRMATLFSWFGIEMKLRQETILAYNEASLVRNTLLHRYGYLEPRHANKFPALAQWSDKVIPMSTERARRYHQAIADLIVALSNGFFACKEYK
ncbi:hypothetical protein [Pseudomonas sp. 313]|uniref:hypothetical protein n=1 Tax=Pseudomonas sp. 313 TaxID=1234594 RepID=UPI0012FAB08F|nr:hypothetical protein [Pseudomonas sp. 313]